MPPSSPPLRGRPPYEARDAATSVLQTDPHNVKALFRRAVALRHLKEYPAALADVPRGPAPAFPPSTP